MGQFSDLIDEPQDAGRANLALTFGVEANPDQTAEAQRLAKRYRLPLSLVESDPQTFKRQAQVDDGRKAIADAPKTQGWLAYSDANAKIAHDDLDNLAGIERTLGGTAGDVAVSALKGAMGLPQAAVGLADIPTFGYTGKLLEAMGLDFNAAQKIASELYSPAQQAASRRVQGAEGFFETLGTALKNPSVIAASIGESVPQMLGGAAAARGLLGIGARALAPGLAGPALPGALAMRFGAAAPIIAGAAGEGIVGAGAAAEQIRGENIDGTLSIGQVAAAIASGAGTGALALAGGKLAQKLGITDIDTALASGQLGKEAIRTGLVKSLAAGGISEGLFEELPQSAQEQVWQNLATDKPLLEGVPNAAAMGLLSGAVMGGGFQGVQYFAARQVIQADQTQRDVDKLGGALELIAQSKVMTRDRATMQSFVQAMADRGEEPGTLYISPVAFEQALQQSGIDISTMPTAAAQYEDAKQRGGDMEIPTGELLTAIAGTGAEQAFLQSIRTAPDAPTLAEVQADAGKAGEMFREEADRIAAQQESSDQWNASAQEVEDFVSAQLQATGMRPEDAQADAQLHRAFASVMADKFTRAGQTMLPMEFFQQQALRVTRAPSPADSLSPPPSGSAGLSGAFEQSGTTLDDVRKQWDAAGIEHGIYEKNGIISLSQIIVPKGERGTGKGTSAMQALVDYADRTNQRVVLSPATDFGASSKARLVKFYKRFGFVENKGRNKDFAISETMYREPSIGNRGTFDPNDSNDSNILKQFAGQQAQTADWNTLATAQQRIDAGDDTETVRKETGWFKGKDDKWRFEISDRDASLAISTRKAEPLSAAASRLIVKLDRPLRIADVLEHPNLYAAYPIIKEYGVSFGPRKVVKGNGSIRSGQIWLADDMDARQSLSTLLHEIQHGIQAIEGFATGWSADAPYLPGMREKVIASNVEMLRRANVHDPENPFSSPDNLLSEEQIQQMAIRNADDLDQRGDVYRRMAGEVEARNTQRRSGMTNTERRDWPPQESSDVPAADVIVVFNGKEMASAPTPANVFNSGSAPRATFNPATAYEISDASGKAIGFATGDSAESALAKFNRANATQAGASAKQTPLISLLADANLSSFLHESAHFFLTVYSNVAAQPNAPAEIRQDMDALLKWMGIEPTPELSAFDAWSAMTLDEQRPYHEKFAETWEQYLFTGKAPSIELQPMFRKFASWMKRVYQSVKNFIGINQRASLDPTVSAIFDRMLATEQEIEAAEAAQNYRALFKTAEEEGMTPEQWAEYQETNADAKAKGEEDLTARALRELKWLRNMHGRMVKALQKESRALRAETMIEARREVMSQPIYRAWQFLTGKLGEGENAAGRLNLASLSAIGLPDEIIGHLKALKMTAKDGMHPDLVAGLFGFESGDDMVRQIAIAPRPKEAIEAETDRLMLDRHAELATPEAINEAADAAIHNEARAKAVALELKWLRADLGTWRVLVKAAKEYAIDLIGRKRVRDVKPHVFAAAEARAAKAAEKALAKGDRDQAAKDKRAQLLNNAATREAHAVRREVQDALTFFRKVTKGSAEQIAKRRDPDIVMAARAVLAAYGIGLAPGRKAAAYLEAVKSYDPAMHDQLAERMANLMDNAQDYRLLTVSDFRALRDEIDAFWYLARQSRTLEIDGDRMDIEDAEAELMGRMAEIGIPDRIPGEGYAVTEAEKRAMKYQTAAAFLRRVESWVGSMDGKPMGPFRRLIWSQVRDAADRYRADKAEKIKQFRNLVDQVAPTLVQVEIAAPELGYTFGKGKGGMGMVELLHAILHTGNLSNLRKLLLGRGWGSLREDGSLDTTKWDQFIARMVREGRIKKVHYDFAQGVWDLMESMKPLAQETHRAVFGRYFDEVTAEPVVTLFGTYRGGYVPAMADPDITADAKTRTMAEAENASMAYSFPSTPKGFTKARVEYNRPLMLDLRTLTRHIDKVLLFSHMEKPVRDARKLLTRTDVSTALHRISPAAFDSMLTPWLNRTAQQVVETPIQGSGPWMRMLSKLRARVGMVAMFANVANAVQQVTGLSLAAIKVEKRHLLAAMAQSMKNPASLARSVSEQSSYMATRMDNEVAMLNEHIDAILLNPTALESAQAWSQRHAYFLQTGVDNIIGPIVWMGAYNQALETADQAITGADLTRYARRLADSAVRETQGSTMPEDVSRIETGTAFVRLFSQFAGYFNMNANLLGNEFVAITRDIGLKNGAGRGLYVLLFGLLIPAWIGEAIMQAFRGGPDDEEKDGEYLDDWLAAVMGWGLLRYLTAMVPGVGQAINASFNAWNKKPYDDRMSTGPAVSMIESAAKAPKSVYEAIVNEGKPSKAIRDVSALVGLKFGVPLTPAAKALGYAADVSDDRVQPTGALDVLRGTITGVPSPESKVAR